MPHDVDDWAETAEPLMVPIFFVLHIVIVLCPYFYTSSLGYVKY